MFNKIIRKMESFKFVVDPNKNCSEQFEGCLKLDVITVIQYYCLRKLLADNNVNTCDTYCINCTQPKLDNDCGLDNYPMFYTSFNKYVDLYASRDSYSYYYISWNELIDKFKEILLTDKFNDIINNHVINKYNSVYTWIHNSLPRKTHKSILMKDYMYVLDDINTSKLSLTYRDNCYCQLFYLVSSNYKSFYPVVCHDSCVSSLVNEYTNHVIDNGNNIDNTMSDNIVYTSDLEVTKQVLSNNQKIIANIVKNLKNETSDSNKQKLMRLLTGEETKPELKPKQRTKITL